MTKLPVLPIIPTPYKEIATSMVCLCTLAVSIAIPDFIRTYTGLVTIPIFITAYAFGVTIGTMAATFWLFMPIFLREVLGYPDAVNSIETVWLFRPMTFVLAIFIGYMSDLNNRLRSVIEENNALRGILPVCARCKKIRNEEGYWEEIDLYIRNHSEAEISHGLCLDCAKDLYPDNAEELEKMHYDNIVNKEKDADSGKT